MAEFSFTLVAAKSLYKQLTGEIIGLKQSKHERSGYNQVFIYDKADHSIGHFSYICDMANCGVLHISHIVFEGMGRAKTMFKVIDVVARCLDRRILTYNTSDEQGDFEDYLEEFGFVKISSKYKNPRSENVISFHLKKVKV